MMVMTAKVDIKKILIGLVAAVAVILGLVFLLGGGKSAQTAAPAMSGNDARVQYLQELGWSVSASPVQSGQVKIPTEQSAIYSRYNELQKEAGFDLTQYAGKTVMRYVYKVNNHESAEPVYATLLVFKDKVIGGDVLDTAPSGKIVSLKKTSE
jgi:hypothetical protein